MSERQPTALREAIATGLRKCREEDAPIRCVHEADVWHIAYMVSLEIEALFATPPRPDTHPTATPAIETGQQRDVIGELGQAGKAMPDA